MSTAPKFRNPGLDEFATLIRKGELTIVDRELITNILVPIAFNEKYIKTHGTLIDEFVEEVMKNTEDVASRTALYILNDYDLEEKLGEIDVPTLILSGDEDAFIFPEESRLMHRRIKNSKLQILSPHIGHMIQFEALEESNRALENFLALHAHRK